ncbi:MAG: 7-carboxy-7-deazaguanine synthase QueE [Phycisphaerales bacterium]|nr:7-carboxy-7-deazaguanine synthase QueE [Phycisphaerales bacterium]
MRLRGCHLRCRYCDTEYSFTEGGRRSVASILQEVLDYDCPLVEITGGEPLLQANVHELMSSLCDRDRTVLLETSGACDISSCDSRVIRILDLKTPGSGEVDRNDWSNITALRQHDEVKFVLTDRADYEWMKQVLDEHRLVERVGVILASPVHTQPSGKVIPGMQGLDPQHLAEWILEDALPVRMQLQLHKFIWDPSTRGV